MARRFVQDKYYTGVVIQCGACLKVLSNGFSKVTLAQEDAMNNGAVVVEDISDGFKFHCKRCTSISRETGKRKRRE